MTLSLRTKILGSFAFIVLVSMALAVGSGNRFTRSRYDAFAEIRDINRARGFAPFLGEWTAAATESAERGRGPQGLPGELLWSAPERFGENGPNPPRMMDRMMNSMMERHRDPRMPPPGVDRVLITDPGGRVLLDTAGYGQDRLAPDDVEPVEIRHDGTVAGYLYIGRMIPGGPAPPELNFFRAAGIATWLTTAVVFLLAMLLGVVLTNHIVRPVRTLDRAARDVARGRLSVRVPDDRRDEIGALSRGFNAMTAALEDADRRRRRFIADSAHELRTPVSLIRSRIEMMEEGVYPMDPENLAALADESERLVQLVEELRLLSSLESPEYTPHKAEVDLADVARGAVAAVAPLAESRKLSVALDILEDRTVVQGDERTLHRLAANLLSNALRHAASRVRVVLESGADDRELILRVDDDGPGIPPEERDGIFRRFYRTDASRHRDSGGSGLGLAICREIAVSHGGRIEAAESPELGGASLRVHLSGTG